MVSVVNMSRDVYEQGRYSVVKTRLTTKREEECEGGRDIIYGAVQLVVPAT